MSALPPRDEPFFSFVLAGMRRPALWEWPTWTEGAPALDALVALAGEPAAVRSVQSEGEPAAQSRFGRLTWSDASHQRWVLGAPRGRADSSSRKFFFTEIWAPSWGACGRQGVAPLLFVAIENPHILADPRPAQFNQLLHVALPCALAREHRAAVAESLRQLAAVTESALSVFRVAPWWRGSDSLQSGLTNHFNYAGRDDDDVPDLARLRTPWTPFDGWEAAIRV